MTIFCGIYGYGITKEIALKGITLTPKYSSDHQIAQRHRDTKTHHLTALAQMDDYDPKILFDLEGILTFIEGLDVLICSPLDLKSFDGGVFSQFSNTINIRNRGSDGECIMMDSFSRNGRSDFIKKTLDKLNDQTFCNRTKFRSAFFKCVETFRQRTPFLDVSYFFLFSALESFARGLLNDYSNKNAAIPISKLLRQYGFNINQENMSDLKRSALTYTSLRNTLFHHGDLEVDIKGSNGVSAHIRLTDYHQNLAALMPLVMMKAVGFDDGHINWDRWIDRMPFI